MVDRLLGQAEVPVPAESDLDEHENRRRTRVDRDDVQLGAPDPDLATENRPAGCGELGGDEQLGRIAPTLLRGAHAPIFGRCAACRLIRRSESAASGGSERLQPEQRELVGEVGRLGQDRGALLEQVERQLVAGQRSL